MTKVYAIYLPDAISPVGVFTKQKDFMEAFDGTEESEYACVYNHLTPVQVRKLSYAHARFMEEVLNSNSN